MSKRHEPFIWIERWSAQMKNINGFRMIVISWIYGYKKRNKKPKIENIIPFEISDVAGLQFSACIRT